MTPSPKPGRGSAPGSAGQNLTVKQQRAASRAKKLEEYHRQQRRAGRNRTIGIAVGALAVVAVIALVVTVIVATPKPASYTAGGSGKKIQGVQTFSNTAGHVDTPVTYAQTPPAGGEHNPIWLNCGVYDQPVPNENAVHALEHGAVWVTYDPSLSASELDALKAKLPSSYAVLSPYKGLPAPIVLSAWNAQLKVDSADDKRIAGFFEEYWKGGTAPEIGAPCTGGLDAPGKVS